MDLPLTSYIIHLRRAVQRQPNVVRLTGALPCKSQVIDAIDGQKLTTDDVNAVYWPHNLINPRFPFVISNNEIACFLSHRKAWAQALADNQAAALILEDDVQIDAPVFSQALALALKHIEKMGIIQFQVREIDNPGKAIFKHGVVHIVCPELVPLRLSCTLYSRAALERLLALTERFDRPVDGVMQLVGYTLIRPGVVIPSGASDLTHALGGTTIQHKSAPFLARLNRELFRPFYRRAIRRHSSFHADIVGMERLR